MTGAAEASGASDIQGEADMKRFVIRFLSLCLCGVVLMLLPACTGNNTDQRGNIGLNDDSSLDGIVKENGSKESTEHPEPTEPTESTESPEPTETMASINFPEFSEPSELPYFPVSPDSWMVVDKAYALEEGESLPDKVTIIGMVVSVDTPWSDRNRNITVTIVAEDRKDEPSVAIA